MAILLPSKIPAATYLFPGTYTIQLTAGNSGGNDVVVKTSYITVYPQPTINFDASQTTGCFPLPVQFTDKPFYAPGQHCVMAMGFLANGQVDSVTNPGHVYMAQGSYNVSLQATNSDGCTNTLTKPTYIQSTAVSLPALVLRRPTVAGRRPREHLTTKVRAWAH